MRSGRNNSWPRFAGLALSGGLGCGGCSSVSAPEEGVTSAEASGGETEDARETEADEGGFVERGGMMRVPGGPFWRGCNEEIEDRCETADNGGVLYNLPYREIELSEFWIDKYEVTVEAYQKCGDAGVCTPAGGVSWSEFEPPDVANLPMTGVTWTQAESYCAWVGKRLPTEAEWEKAARGIDGRRYPWGNEEPTCGQAHLLVSEDCRTRHALPVDAYPEDVSPYGVVGMIGNVQEWVHDWAARSYYQVAPSQDPPGPARDEAYRDTYKVVRGGYWDSAIPLGGLGGPSLSLRRWGDWEQGLDRVGFRCARSDPPPE